MNNPKAKKIIEIASNVLLYLFLAICIFSLTLTIFAKKDSDGTAEIFGYQLRIVVTESMAKCDETDVSDFDIKSIPLRSMVFVETVPEDKDEADAWFDGLNEGDVLTFKYVYASQVTITHRITKITPDGDGYIIELQGDNKASTDNQGVQVINTNERDTSPNYVVGKVVGQSRIIGFILSILKEPVGLICVIIVPCAIVIIMEIIKIVNVLGAERKQKADEENKKKDDELFELRRKLAELEKAKEAMTAEASATEEPKAEPEATEESAAEKAEEDIAPENCESDGSEEPVEESIEESVEDATEESTKESVENATEDVAEEIAEESTDESTEEVADDLTEEIAEDAPAEEADESETSLSDEN